MKKTAYELVSSWLPEDRKQRVYIEMKKKAKIDGFRTGKAPVSKILNLLPNQPSLQKAFMMEVFLNYFPASSFKTMEIGPLLEEKADENFPGVMAAYFLKNPGGMQSIPDGMQEWINQYEQKFLSDPEISEENDIQPDEPEPEENTAEETIPDQDESPVEEPESGQDGSLVEASEAVTAVETASPETEPAPPAADSSEKYETKVVEENRSAILSQTHDEKKVPGPKVLSALSAKDLEPNEEETLMEYHSEHLGYVLKESMGANSTFYNFYPTAKINEDGFFVPYDRMEAKIDYPLDGKINLSSKDRNYRKLQTRFQKGGIYILEIEEHFVQDNLNAKGDFYPVQNKIDIEDIEEFNFLHKPEEAAYQYYQVCTVKNLPKLLCDGKLILIQGAGAKRALCEHVLLRDEETGLMAGPLPVKHQLAQRGDKEMSWFADPHTDGPQYIYNVYSIIPGTGPMISFSADNDPDHKIYLAKLPALNKTRRDFITDEILLREVHDLVQKSGGGNPDFTQSLFCSHALPDEIIADRIKRMEQIFQRDLNLHEIANRFSGTIANLLLKSLESDIESGGGEIVQKLAETPAFLNQVSKYRKFQAVVDQKQHELESVLSTCQEKIDLQTEKIAALDARKSDYQKTVKKYNLADDISALAAQKDVLGTDLRQMQAERDQAARERDEIKTQTEQLLGELKTTLKNPLKGAADVIIHRRLYDALYASMASDDETQPSELPAADVSSAALQPLPEPQLMAQLMDSFHNYRPGFTDNDIINLYICLTQGFLTVFAGAPGTGKTSACRILAHSLGLDSDENPRFILVPVERGWGSKRDFIGYYNPLTKSFDRSNSQVYEALETSDAESERYEKEPIPPQIILLDEANLSQMEYYWSVFMNAADYSPKSALVDLGNGKTFRVSKALRFLATINNDNTTEGLSPRLIDRAWIISLPTGGDFREVDFTDVLSLVSMQELTGFFGRKPGAVTIDDLDPACSAILKDMYSFCQELHLDVSERSKGAILQYCLAGSRMMQAEKERREGTIAADYAISQKILPRLQGHGTVYRDNVLNRLKVFFQKHHLTKCEAAMDRILREGNENMNYYHFFSLGQA